MFIAADVGTVPRVYPQPTKLAKTGLPPGLMMAENIPCSLTSFVLSLTEFQPSTAQGSKHKRGKSQSTAQWFQGGCVGRLQVMVGNWRKMGGTEV